MVWPFDGIQQQIQRAPEQMVEGATREAGGWLSRNWLLLLALLVGGPVVASNFRDRLPEGMSWLTDIGDFFIGLLSRLPFVGNFFGNMIQGQAENWTAEEAQDNLERTAHLPEQLSQALAPNNADWQRTARWFREEGGTTVTNPVTQRSVTRMLTTESGREIARRLIAGAANARRNGTLTTSTEAPATTENDENPLAGLMAQAQGAIGSVAGGNIMESMRNTLVQVLRGENGNAILNDPAAMDVLYSGVYAFTGIEFTTQDAMQTYMRDSGLNAEGQRALLVGLMGNEQTMQRTLGKLLTGDAPFTGRNLGALHTLIGSITPETTPAAFTRFQSMTPEVFEIAGPAAGSAMQTMPAGQTAAESSSAEQTTEEQPDAATRARAQARMLTQMLVTPNMTGGALVALVSEDLDEAPAALRPILSNETHAQSLINLAQRMGTPSFEAFANAIAGIDADPETQPAQYQAALGNIIATMPPDHRALAVTFLDEVKEALPGMDEGMLTTLRENPEQVVQYNAVVTNSELSTEQEASLQSALRNAENGSYTKLIDLLMDEEMRVALGEESEVTDIVPSVTRIVALGGEQTSFLTESDANLTAMCQLIYNIDNASGGEAGTEAEQTADENNARMMAFVMGMAQGQPVHQVSNTVFRWDREFRLGNTDVKVKAEDLAHFFRDNREALQIFFQTQNVGGDSPVFAALRARFWDDINQDGQAGGSEGLLAILQQGDALGQLLGLMARNPGQALTEADFRSLGLGTDGRILANADALRVLGASFAEGATVESVERADTPPPVQHSAVTGARGGASGNQPFGV